MIKEKKKRKKNQNKGVWLDRSHVSLRDLFENSEQFRDLLNTSATNINSCGISTSLEWGHHHHAPQNTDGIPEYPRLREEHFSSNRIGRATGEKWQREMANPLQKSSQDFGSAGSMEIIQVISKINSPMTRLFLAAFKTVNWTKKTTARPWNCGSGHWPWNRLLLFVHYYQGIVSNELAP